LVYAPHGIGKTSLAAGAPDPVFLQTEDGLGMIDAATFGLLTTYAEVIQAIDVLGAEAHDFKSVVIDTMDWLEPIVWTEACRLNGWANIEQPGYGKGYVAVQDVWRAVLERLTALRDIRSMAVIMLAHCHVKRFDPPDSEPYDRYQPKMHDKASALIQEHADGVMFMNYRVSIVKDNPKDKDSRVRGVGGGSRVVYTTERPSHLAKNRWRMPDQIVMPDEPEQMWPKLAEALPFYTQATTEKAT
jgi:hypothetical protein